MFPLDFSTSAAQLIGIARTHDSLRRFVAVLHASSAPKSKPSMNFEGVKKTVEGNARGGPGAKEAWIIQRRETDERDYGIGRRLKKHINSDCKNPQQLPCPNSWLILILIPLVESHSTLDTSTFVISNNVYHYGKMYWIFFHHRYLNDRNIAVYRHLWIKYQSIDDSYKTRSWSPSINIFFVL